MRLSACFLSYLACTLLPLNFTAQAQSFTPVPPIKNTIMAQELVRSPAISKNRASTASRSAYVQSSDMIFPHFATGGGWETILVLVNLTNAKIDFTQSFYDTAGNPMAVTFKSVPGDELTTTSSASGTLNPYGSFNILLFDQGGGLQTGWSAIDYDSTNTRIGGYAIFRQRLQGSPDFEALVPLSAYDDSIFVMPFDNIEGFSTSMAILNPGVNMTTTVRVTIMDPHGDIVGTDNVFLDPGQQKAFSIPERFPITKNRIGTILFEGSTNRLSGLGFRFNPGHAFATIPILNWSGMFN